MYVELEAFVSESELYNKKVADIKNDTTNPEELERRLEEERLRFKGTTRRYLPIAISYIKTKFNCDYSLYKVGKDVDANFKTIETNVSKTQTEVLAEMQQFVQIAIQNNFSDADKNKLNLAINVIMSYIDDTQVDTDKNKEFFLNHSKVVASSLALPVTQKLKSEVQLEQVQYNPYANNPITSSSLTSSNVVETNSKTMLDNPFAAIYNGTAEPTPTENIDQVGIDVPKVPVIDLTQPTIQNEAEEAINQLPTHDNTEEVVSQQSREENTQETVIQPVNNPVSQSNFVNNVNYNPTDSPKIGNMHESVLGPIISTAPNQAPVSNFKQGFNPKNPLAIQIVCALLIPVLVLLASFIVTKISALSFIISLLAGSPAVLSTTVSIVIIAVVCFILGKPIVMLAKSESQYIERFLVAPAAATYALYLLYGKIITALGLMDFELAIYYLAGSVFMFYYVTFLFVQAFVSTNTDEKPKVKWNIFEKIGVIYIVYFFIINALVSIAQVDFLDDFIELIYLTNTPIGQYIDDIFLIGSIFLPILIIGSRLIESKKVGE